MLQIDEERFCQLKQFESELNYLFENIVIQYVKEWKGFNKSKSFEYFDNKDEVADYVNLNLKANSIVFNGTTPYVWFNSQGTGSMLYWATYGSKEINGVNELLK